MAREFKRTTADVLKELHDAVVGLLAKSFAAVVAGYGGNAQLVLSDDPDALAKLNTR